MAIVIGAPGNSARVRVFGDRILMPVLVLSLLFIVCVPATVFAYGRSALHGNIALATCVLMTVGIFVFDREWREIVSDFTQAPRWKQGAEGEMLTGAALATLPDSYVIFHDYHPETADGKPAGWNVDHVVVGPTGVFVVESKNYSRPRVDPANKSSFTRKNVAQTDGNAIEFKKALVAWSGGSLSNLFVRPLLVYTQPKAFVEKPFEGRVKVIPLKWLIGDITAHREGQLDVDQIYRISRVLFMKMRWEFRDAFQGEFDRLSQVSKQTRLERVAQEREMALNTTHTPPTRAEEPTAAPLPTVCPQCGATLVRRIAHKGPRAGLPFLGCSGFAKTGCRYILNLEDE